MGFRPSRVGLTVSLATSFTYAIAAVSQSFRLRIYGINIRKYTDERCEEMAQPRGWTEIEKKEMLIAYENGETVTSIAKRYETSHTTVASVLRTQGIQFRAKNGLTHFHMYDGHYFQTIDTEEKAYWIGFLTADGCITTGNRITIHLSSVDCGHLEKLKQALKATQMISQNSRSCSLVICSSEMAADLATHGIHPKKTLSTKPVQVSPELERHYWRGVIDGDGHISKDGNQLVLVGDYEVVLGFQTFVLTHCPKVKAGIFRDLNIYTFKITGTSARKMLEILYGEATVYLERKYERAHPDFP